MPGGHALSAHDSGGLKRLHRVCVSSLGLAHRNIMKEDMLGVQGRKKEAQVGAFFTGGKHICCMLFYKLRSMSMTVAFQQAAGGVCVCEGGRGGILASCLCPF